MGVRLLSAIFSFLLAPLGYGVGTREKRPDIVNVLINGGYSQTSNLEDHERELEAYYASLKGNAVVLNAGGKGAKIVTFDRNGFYHRDTSGLIELTPTSLKMGKRATKENVRQTIAQVAAENPREANFIFSDHGDPTGVALWGSATLSYPELRDDFSAFPESTVVRTIHHQCFSGAMIGESHGSPPGALEDYKDYLQKRFPKNRCGLAMGRADEMTDYGDHLDVIRAVDRRGRISLQSVYDYYQGKESHASTPVKTSDLFIEDVADYVCLRQAEREIEAFHWSIQELKRECKLPSEPKFQPSPWLYELDESLVQTLCDFTVRDQRMRDLEWQLRLGIELDSEFGYAESEVAHEYMKEVHPEISEKYVKAYEVWQRLLAKPEQRVEDLPKEKVATLQRYDRLRRSLRGRADFEDYFRKRFLKLLREKKESYPELTTWGLLEGRSPRQIEGKINSIWESAGSERKELGKTIRKEREAIVQSFLNREDGAFKEIREQYENIRECEKSPLS